MNIKQLALAMVAVASAGATTSVAGAATLTASAIHGYSNPSLNEYVGASATSGTSVSTRSNLTNLLGAADGKLYSIGERGFVIIGFGISGSQSFSGATTIIEIGAGGNSSVDREQGEVYVGNNVNSLMDLALGDTSNALSVGHIGSNMTTSINIANGPWSYLLIKDTSFGGNTTYGIDIDSVKVTAATDLVSATAAAVPLPASAWGGLGLLGAIAAKRFYKRHSK